jgi:predicted PurR-regulated permease PerM
VGLHPVAVIFAVMAGGQLFGFFGVLLAIPAAAAIAVWLRHLHVHFQGGPRRPRRKSSKKS